VRRIAVAVFIAGAAALTATPGQAQPVGEQAFAARTASDLATLCSAPVNQPRGAAARNFCEGFAQGAIDVGLTDARSEHRPPPFCFPRPAPSRISTLQEFVTWARADPSRLSQPAASALFRFMGERFPCPKP